MKRSNCASCTPTNAPATGDASLASHGLSLTDDGRVFFDSTDALVLRDGNERKDVYEWEVQGAGNCNPDNHELLLTGTACRLISSGTSPFDSGLLSVSADGIDAYFFTHDTSPMRTRTGPSRSSTTRAKTAASSTSPLRPLCAASDECHGPGTKAAAAGDPHDLRRTGQRRAVRLREGLRQEARQVREEAGQEEGRTAAHKKRQGEHANERQDDHGEP